MRNLLLFALLYLAITYNANAQYSTYLKTNLLNIPITPSIHVEQQIKSNQSLQLDFHRTRFQSINEVDLLNAALTYRFYLRKVDELNGFYLGPNIGLHHNYNAIEYTDSVNYLEGNTYLGLGAKLGYQKTVLKDRIALDTNLGLWIPAMQTKDFQYFTRKAQARLMIGVGYRIKK